MEGLLGGLGGLAVCFCTSMASAQTSEVLATAAEPHTVNAAPQLADARSERRWYGWQGAVLDAGVVALGTTSLVLVSSDWENYEEREQAAELLFFVGAVVYGAGPPTIHLGHRQPWQALGSLGLRVALPAIGGASGLSLATCPHPGEEYGNCGMLELMIGASTGAVVAMVLDASLLAWESPKSGERSGTQLGVTPVMSRDGRRELRVFGTF